MNRDGGKMNIIVGATGQVGSNIVKELVQKQIPVRAILHKTKYEFDKTVEIRTADLLNVDDVIQAFNGGTTAFLLTPERPDAENIVEEAATIIANYRAAVEEAGIKRIILLSCIGAHVEKNTGNILMSGMLERAFNDMNIEKIFVRPSYYYSNWLAYLDLINETGILPTFFPPDLKIEMHSAVDVAKFSAQCIENPANGAGTAIYELVGPKKYSSQNIANVFSDKLKREVNLQIISKEERMSALLAAGFTANTAQNLSDMTQVVIDQTAPPEFPNKTIKLTTTFADYLEDMLK